METQEIIPALRYPYCFFEFQDWNPLQAECYKYFEKDSNLIVSATLAAGKTAVTEAIFGYELSKNDTCKVVYVCPLKALGDEKYRKWKEHQTFSQYQMVLLSSDNYVNHDELTDARFIVATVEALNVCCRRGDKWLKDVRVLTFDEAHLFNHVKRGAGSEALLMNMSNINPDCRIICLSGTLSNVKEVAIWIKKLNGKQTGFVNSNWRPTKLFKSVATADSIQQQIDFLSKTIKANYGDKILIFVHSKKIGELFAKDFRNKGIQARFYSSDLSVEQKRDLIVDFGSEYSDLSVLIATSALAMGIDL